MYVACRVSVIYAAVLHVAWFGLHLVATLSFKLVTLAAGLLTDPVTGREQTRSFCSPVPLKPPRPAEALALASPSPTAKFKHGHIAIKQNVFGATTCRIKCLCCMLHVA